MSPKSTKFLANVHAMLFLNSMDIQNTVFVMPVLLYFQYFWNKFRISLPLVQPDVIYFSFISEMNTTNDVSFPRCCVNTNKFYLNIRLSYQDFPNGNNRNLNHHWFS